MRFLSCCKVFVSVITVEWGWEFVRGVSYLRPNRVLTMDGCKRIDESTRGMFYRSPIVGAKSCYQNLESWHVKVDVAEWGLEIHTSAWRDTFDRRGDLQNKGLWHSSKNMNAKSKASICCNKAHMSEIEIGAQACCSVLSMWASRVDGFDGTYIYISWAMVLVLVCRGCCSLVDNSQLVDNSLVLIDNFRYKHLLIDER